METSADPNIATCPTCGALIDVAEQEPYAKIHCSGCGTWMRVRQMFANYELCGVLGEGGQGLVLKATDKKLKRNVAVKLMKREYSADAIFVKRFQSEAKVTASLSHPNVVKVFSFGEDRGLLYLAMEMVDHGSLDALMSQITKVPEDRMLEVGVQIAKGLQAGLEKGLIHRDIKPGNILFADEQTAKIVDFGLAVLVEKQHEEEGEVWATPYYVAPEKLDGKPEDFRSDMYSLAATLFHALAGRPPFIAETNSMSELKKIKSKSVHLLSFAPHCSHATAYVIDKALSVKPEDRWASYDELIQNLEYARNELRKQPKPRTRPLTSHQTAPAGGSWITIAAVLLVLAGGAFYLLNKKGDGGDGKTGKTPPAKVEKADDAEARYEEARLKLLKGQARLAAVTFRELYADGKLPEPKHSWAAFHEGLGELLDGRPLSAKAAFERLGHDVSPGAIGMDEELSAFFGDFAAVYLAKETVTPADTEKFKADSYQALAVLVFALENWEAGEFKVAVTLLRKFQAAKLEGTSSWVSEYRKLVKPYLEEFAAYSRIADDLTKYTTDLPKAVKALDNLQEVRDTLKNTGLRTDLKRLEEELGPKVREIASTKRSADSERLEALRVAEEKVLTEAKYKMKAFCDAYRFLDAQEQIKLVDVKLEAHVKDKELLIKRATWLVNFKELLVRDIIANGGYAGPLQRRGGGAVMGGIVSASESAVSIRIGAGSAQIQWSELTPASLLAMAKSFIKPTQTPEVIAQRQWLAAVFCIFEDLTQDSYLLMTEAAGSNVEYQEHKEKFFPSKVPEPGGLPVEQSPGASPAPKADDPTGTGLEMSKQPLNPNNVTPTDPSLVKKFREGQGIK
jgi:tRNA A-37 threonylcarbamoyl transferase component Bud32